MITTQATLYNRMHSETSVTMILAVDVVRVVLWSTWKANLAYFHLTHYLDYPSSFAHYSITTFLIFYEIKLSITK